MVIQRGQRTVAEAEKPGVNVPLVALDALALQVQLGFGSDNRFDIVGLGQGVHVHVIVDHQQAAFQIGTGKAVVLDFLDAAVAGGISHEPFEHQPDAGLGKTSAFVQAELARNAKNAAIFGGKATKAQQAAAAAVQGGAKVAADAAGRMGLLGSAVRGVTGLLGGPVGLIATAVLFRSEIESGIRSVVEWGMSFTEAGRQMQKAEAELKRMEATARAQKAAADEAAAAANRLAQEQEAARNASFGLSKEGQGLIATFQGMVREGKRVDEALAKIGEGFDLSGKAGIQNAAAVLDKLQADGQITAEQFAQAWQGALEKIDLGVFAVNAQTALQGGAREAERLAQVMDAVVHQAVLRTGLDFDVLQGKIGAASRSAINDADAIAASMERLQAQGVDAARALQVSLSKAIKRLFLTERLS